MSMAAKLLVSIFISACAVSVCQGWLWTGSSCWKWSSTETKLCVPCQLATRNVTLVVKNVLRPDNFEETVTLTCTRFKTLFNMMIEAAEKNAAFKFDVTYFKGLGFFVNAINGLAGNYTLDKTWWQILDGNGQQTPVGVSSYEPKDGEVVTFNFTQGFGH